MGGGMGGAMGCPGGGTDPNRWTAFRNMGLLDNELQGLAVFNDPKRANCASCHTLESGPDGYPLFTDFGYDNLGIPKNPDNPFYAMPPAWNPDSADWIDYGLGGYLKRAGYAPEDYEPEMGKRKVPTLRNVDLRPFHSPTDRGNDSCVILPNLAELLIILDSCRDIMNGSHLTIDMITF